MNSCTATNKIVKPVMTTRTGLLCGAISLAAATIPPLVSAAEPAVLEPSVLEQQRCYQGLCATLTSPVGCPEPGQPISLHFSGTLADAGSFSITSYELLTDADWQLTDNHQIQVLSHAGALSNDGFVLGGRFEGAVDIDPDNGQRYTLIHRYRSRSHGYFAVAVDLQPAQETANSSNLQLDIKPGSCPNPINMGQKGVTPVAIVGTGEFDVRTLDLDSIRLQGVAPVRYRYDDVTSEIADKSSSYDCTTSTSDGKEDLSLTFLSQQLAAAVQAKLGRAAFDGERVTLRLTASAAGGDDSACGSLLTGEDSIQALVKGER